MAFRIKSLSRDREKRRDTSITRAGRERSRAHLSWRRRRLRCRAGGGGRPVAVGRGTILKRVRFERNRRSEILVKGNPGSDSRSIQEGSSGTGAATADLQGAVNFVYCVFSLV